MHPALGELQGDGRSRILIEAHNKSETPRLELQVFLITVKIWNCKKIMSPPLSLPVEEEGASTEILLWSIPQPLHMLPEHKPLAWVSRGAVKCLLSISAA